MGADTNATAPSGPETPWERYMRQEWPMDRDRFNALVAAEVGRATAEWKARAEKAEAKAEKYYRCWTNEVGRLRAEVQDAKARAEKAEAALRGVVGCMPTGATQAHEEAGARRSDQEELDIMFKAAPIVHARKTQEPPSAVGNTPPRAESGTGGGSATPTWAALRPWLEFVETHAAWWRVSDDGVDGNVRFNAMRDAARALLVATKKEGK